MPTNAKESINEWLSTAFKAAVFCIFTMFTFLLNQFNQKVENFDIRFNQAIEALTMQLKNLEVKFVDTDKRVNGIEVARGINTERFEKLMGDVEQMKQRITEQGMRQEEQGKRLQTIADFVAKRNK